MNAHLEGLEKERDFYFAKVSVGSRPVYDDLAGMTSCAQLRDIEIIIQQQLETLQAEDRDDPILRDVQKILYSTEVSASVIV